MASYCWLYFVSHEYVAKSCLSIPGPSHEKRFFRNLWHKLLVYKNERIERIEFKPFKVEQMVRDLYLNHNIEVLPQAEGSENDIELMKTLKEMFGEAIRTHYYISK